MIEIIPAIDIIDGKCVRLSQGDYQRKNIYNEHPLEVAKQFEAVGIKRLHLVDLDGARQGKIINQKILESISVETQLIIDFGGGIKTDADIESVFNAGADMATVGSIAVKNPKLFDSWIKKYGVDVIFLGADVKEEKIAIAGWVEQTDITIYDFIERNLKAGVKNIFCTDIAKDGMMKGPSLEVYKKIIHKYSAISLTASGGISSINDIQEVARIGCTGVIIGKAIYEGKISLKDLSYFFPPPSV